MITQLDLPSLRSAVEAVAPYAPTKSGLSHALTHLHLRAEEQRLTLTATDLQQTATLRLPYEGGEWEALIDAKRLVTALKRLKGDTVTVSVAEDHTLTLRAGRSTVTLNSLDPHEFPETSAQLGEPVGEVSGDTVARWLAVVAPSMSANEARPNLMGTLITVREGQMDAVSTDGYRLHTIREAVQLSDIEGLVPSLAVSRLARLASRTPSLRLYASDNPALSVTTDTEEGELAVSIRLLSERFPPWGAVVPERGGAGAVTLSLDIAEALEALSVASLVQDGALGRVELTHEGSVWQLCARGEVGEGRGEVSVEASAQAPTVNVSAVYLAQALKVAQRHSERVSVQITAPEAPLLIVPEGADDVRLVVVPLRA